VDAIEKLQVGSIAQFLKFSDLVIAYQLELTLDEVKWAIVAARKLKIKQEVCVLVQWCCMIS
jgi:hypothetical protein